ncbi:DUF4439 domain-containing protein [Arthrobacter sp. Soil763]|uniref:DUF4439 domain-containing protein n=1 Tax=Arthrobacter sp. Soil763 TaxID=1736402 RepID=UPI0009EBF699|nr:DUF4439 domain-containing protein [Arthrobacter sp. Soil763]
MTTWSVVKDDGGTQRRRFRLPRDLPRIALLACLAAVVVSLGFVFVPGNPPKPAAPSVSERARASALADALSLRTRAEQLQATATEGSRAADRKASPAAAGTAVQAAVTLLTTQARALLRPGPSPEASATAAPATTAPATPAPPTAARLAADLASSGRQRLADARTSDGGMARLLASVGTAQLLQSSALAAAAGTRDPAAGFPEKATAEVPGPEVPAAGSCPPATGSPADGTPGPLAAGLPEALAAVMQAELEAVYGYQVALTRLDGAPAAAAKARLAHHEALVTGADTLGRAQCAAVPPREPGYALDQAFLASPGRGLASLEAASLTAYGELVALSEGPTRQWAVAGLLGAARRAAAWGAAPGPFPGLALDPASLPTLPPA